MQPHRSLSFEPRLNTDSLETASTPSLVDASPIKRFDPYWVASIAVFIVLVVVAILVRDDIGVTFDEELQARYGRRILAWYASGFRDRRALGFGGSLVEYGGLFDALAQLAVHFAPRDSFGIRHLASGLCGVLGVVATWKTAARLGGTRAGLISAIVLCLTPAWAGHGMFNPKDIPFAAAAAWVSYGMVCIAIGPLPPNWRSVLVCSLAAGAALGVRPGGMFLLGYAPLAAVVRLGSERAMQPKAGLWRATALRLSVGGALAWSCMLVAWPWAQLAPITRPFEAAWLAAHFGWRGRVLFDGALINSDALPVRYLPTWFALTLPESYLLGAACALASAYLAVRGRRHRLPTLGVACLVWSAFLPLLAALIVRPVLYDGHRHFLFLLPPMAALTGLSISQFIAEPALPRWLRLAALSAFVVSSALVLRDMVALHPFEYVYFNRISGGLAAAQDRFETDYWGATYGEGIDWVVNHLHPPLGRALRVGSCNVGDELNYYFSRNPEAQGRFEFVNDLASSDIFLATTRFDCHKTQGEVLHVVERANVPLLYVIRR